MVNPNQTVFHGKSLSINISWQISLNQYSVVNPSQSIFYGKSQ